MEVRVTHVASIDKEVLLATFGGVLRFAHKATYGYQLCISMDVQQLCSVVVRAFPKNGLNTQFLSRSRQVEQYLVVVHKQELHFGIDEHYMIELRQQVA